MRLARTCCLDLDTFFVSVERLIDPSLCGKAVVVGGAKGGRGVVTSASYEARELGVRSGMSIRDATAAAPYAVFVPGHHEAYGDYSWGAREIVERFSPIVVAASIDEQYVDFHGCESLYRRPGDADDDATIHRVVRTITRTIDEELGLPSSGKDKQRGFSAVGRPPEGRSHAERGAAARRRRDGPSPRRRGAPSATGDESDQA